MSVNPLTEPKAKRTHARRSCELCKIRKTRCELPDIDVPSTNEPLPDDKSCHRCRVLALPCVVDDQPRKIGRKRKAEEGTSGAAENEAGGSRPVGKARGKGKGKTGGASTNGVDHSLDVMTGIHPELEWSHNGGEPALYSSDPFLGASPVSSTFGGNAPAGGVGGMKFQGRPLEVVSAMLRTAYAKSEIKEGRSALTMDKIDWSSRLDANLREKLEVGFAQLRTFHSYLDPLSSIWDKCSTSNEPEEQLLLCTIVYLCTIPLAPGTTITKLRSFLRPRIIFLRDRILIQAPINFTTIQALELIGIHAPFGILPLQLTNPRSVSLARGQIAVLQFVSSQLRFSMLFKGLATKTPEPLLFNQPDVMLYLSITALESIAVLENEVPKAPPSLADANALATQYLDESREYLWRNAQDVVGQSGLIGRLGVFDRLSRVGEVLDSLDRLRVILERAAADTSFSGVDAISEEFDAFGTKMDRIDARHEAILNIISPITPRGYVMHRSMRRQYEHVRILCIGLRYLIATSYIPGSRTALPGVPTDLPVHQRITYAINRATNPADIMPVLTQSSPATMVIWQYGTVRGELCQQLLSTLADLEPTVIPKSHRRASDLNLEDHLNENENAELIPLHESIVFAVDAAKMLMEARAGTLLLHKRSGNLHEATLAPIWVHSLKKACQTLRLIGLLSPSSALGDLDRGPGQGETIANGCSNILGSMLRMTEEWARVFGPAKPEESVGPSGFPGESQDAHRRYGEDGQNEFGTGGGGAGDLLHGHHSPFSQHLQAQAHDAYPGADQPSYDGSAYPPLPPADAPPQGYMDSSDRWMAGGSGSGVSGDTSYARAHPQASPHHGQGQGYHDDPYGSATGSGSGNHTTYPPQQLPQQPPPQIAVNNDAAPGGQAQGQGQGQGAGYAPTAMDLLLSQMFQYGPPPQ